MGEGDGVGGGAGWGRRGRGVGCGGGGVGRGSGGGKAAAALPSAPASPTMVGRSNAGGTGGAVNEQGRMKLRSCTLGVRVLRLEERVIEYFPLVMAGTSGGESATSV